MAKGKVLTVSKLKINKGGGPLPPFKKFDSISNGRKTKVVRSPKAPNRPGLDKMGPSKTGNTQVYGKSKITDATGSEIGQLNAMREYVANKNGLLYTSNYKSEYAKNGRGKRIGGK